jgi:hypothetical protein
VKEFPEPQDHVEIEAETESDTNTDSAAQSGSLADKVSKYAHYDRLEG